MRGKGCFVSVPRIFSFDSNRLLANRDQYMDFDVLEFSLPIFCFAMDIRYLFQKMESFWFCFFVGTSLDFIGTTLNPNYKHRSQPGLVWLMWKGFFF